MIGTGNKANLLRELEKWQASSHPDLADCQPEELFGAGFGGIYQQLHKDLWWRLSRLHGTICTLEQLREFPFGYLYAPDRMEFWRLVIENFVDAAIAMLHGLVNDTGKDVHSLVAFRDQIVQGPWLSQEKKDLFMETLRERKFDGFAKGIARRVDVIRDNWVAHRLVDKGSGSPKEALATVGLEELRHLFDAAHSLFAAFSFGSTYITLAGDLMPGTVGGQVTRSCLDDVLDAVLRHNHFVNEPERQPQLWGQIREHTDAGRLKVMNELRRRIGLPEA